MIGLDTNVLARYCVEDSTDLQAARQRLAAGRLIESGQAPMVCKTVVLELDFARLAGKLGLLPGVGLPRRRARNRCHESPTHPAQKRRVRTHPGNSTTTSSPGCALRMRSVPPCACATRRHRFRPRPTPPAWRVRALSGR